MQHDQDRIRLEARARVAVGPEVFPNSVKYSDKGAKPATGRSGSVQLMARALLGRDGNTDLEITTGQLDSATAASGTLAKTQIKVLDKEGTSLLTRNDAPGTSLAKYVFPSWVRGQPVQVQANVTGVDAARTDVITVAEIVRLRPDLSVAAIDAAKRAALDAPVTVVGTVRELNGDVGARGDCVLRVDGVVTDWARNVWVDAGGTVGCAFTHSFVTAA